MAFDQAFHRADSFEGAEVQVLAIDKGLEVCQQSLACGDVPGYRPRFDQGIALPIAAVGQVVMVDGVEGQRQRATVAIGPQPHVGAKDDAISGLCLEQGDEALTHLEKKLMVADGLWAAGVAGLTVGKNQIDIRGQVKFPPAEFA